MLETILAYSHEQLALTGDGDAVRRRHHDYYLALAQLHGSEKVLMSADGARHLAELDGEIDNLHEALRWAVDRGGAQRALTFCRALGCYWWMGNHFAVAVTWVDRALGLPGAHEHPALLVHVLSDKAWCLRWLGRAAEQPAILSEAQAIARKQGDPATLAMVLHSCANRETIAGRPDLGEPLAEEALRWATTADDEWEIANALSAKAMAAQDIGELRERVERATSLLDEVGNVYQHADLLNSAAYAALCLGSDRDAKELLDRATPLARALDHPYMWMILRGNAGLVALLTGDMDAATAAFREEVTLSRELVVWPIASEGFLGLAAIATVHGDDHGAARLVGAASAHAYGEQQEVIENRLDAAFFRVARGRYGGETWDAATREGAALSFDDAVAYALDQPQVGVTSSAVR